MKIVYSSMEAMSAAFAYEVFLTGQSVELERQQVLLRTLDVYSGSLV